MSRPARSGWSRPCAITARLPQPSSPPPTRSVGSLRAPSTSSRPTNAARGRYCARRSSANLLSAVMGSGCGTGGTDSALRRAHSNTIELRAAGPGRESSQDGRRHHPRPVPVCRSALSRCRATVRLRPDRGRGAERSRSGRAGLAHGERDFPALDALQPVAHASFWSRSGAPPTVRAGRRTPPSSGSTVRLTCSHRSAYCFPHASVPSTRGNRSTTSFTRLTCVNVVETKGLEPSTPCLQSRCATNCATSPVGFRPTSHRFSEPSRWPLPTGPARPGRPASCARRRKPQRRRARLR